MSSFETPMCRVMSDLVPLLDMYSTRELVQPVIVNGTWQKDPVTGALLNQTLPTVSIDFEYLGHVTWGNAVLNAYSNLESNCWGALTTVAPWLATKYGMVGCNITASGDCNGRVLAMPSPMHGLLTMVQGDSNACA
jgi:hypothetical protein